jgi:hypothetical protein
MEGEGSEEGKEDSKMGLMEGIKLIVNTSTGRGGNKVDVGIKAGKGRSQARRRASVGKMKEAPEKKPNDMNGEGSWKEKEGSGVGEEVTKARVEDTDGIGEDYNWWNEEDTWAKEKGMEVREVCTGTGNDKWTRDESKGSDSGVGKVWDGTRIACAMAGDVSAVDMRAGKGEEDPDKKKDGLGLSRKNIGEEGDNQKVSIRVQGEGLKMVKKDIKAEEEGSAEVKENSNYSHTPRSIDTYTNTDITTDRVTFKDIDATTYQLTIVFKNIVVDRATLIPIATITYIKILYMDIEIFIHTNTMALHTLVNTQIRISVYILKNKILIQIYKYKKCTQIQCISQNICPNTKYTIWYNTHNSITKKIKKKVFINTLYKLEKYDSNNNNNKKPKKKTINNKIISVVEPQQKEKQKFATIIPNTKIPNYTYQNKKLLLRCGDIERNLGPKFTLLLNHPQSHQVKHKTYFYKNTTQIKIEYAHIFESFEPYLNQTQTSK